jgi:hypothetical protein
MKKNGFIPAMLALTLLGAVLAGCSGNNKPNQPSDFSTGNTESGGTISGYGGESKSVVIPAEIDGEPVMAIEAYAFADNTDITSVVIPEGVISIGDFAFANCTALKSVTLPASLKIIGDGAFLHCAGLTTVTNLPAAVDGRGSPVLERLGDFAFGGCVKLESKTSAALAELGVTDLALGNPAFSGRTSGVTTAARYNPDLRLVVPYAGLLGTSWDIAARNLFAQYALVNKGNTEARLVSASNKNGAFSGVITLFNEGRKRMELSLVLQSGTDGYNYPVYVELENLETGMKQEAKWDDIPEMESMDFSTGQAIGEAIGKLFFPITEGEFYTVRRLAAASNPGVLSPAVLANEQYQITPEEEFEVGLTESGDGVIIKKYTGDRRYVNIPETIQGLPVRVLGQSSFFNNKTVTAVTIPEGVTTIEGKDEYDGAAFCGCTALASVTIPGSVTSIGRQAFAKSGLVSVDIPEGVESIGLAAFQSCKKLVSVTIQGDNTWFSFNKYGDHGTFAECDSLESVKLPQGLKRVGIGMFYECTSLKSIDIPADVTGIMPKAFFGSGLESIVLPEGVTAIGDEAFDICKNLTSVTIPDSCTRIGWDYDWDSSRTWWDDSDWNSSVTFGGCSNLVTVNITPIKRQWHEGERDPMKDFINCPKLSLASQAALKAAGYTGGF